MKLLKLIAAWWKWLRASQSGNAIDPKFFDFVSQIAHSGATFFVGINGFLFFGLWSFTATLPGVVAYAVWHEFVYDP